MARAANASLAEIAHGADLSDQARQQGIALSPYWAEYERGYGWVACTRRGRLGYFETKAQAERNAGMMYAKEGDT